MPKIPEVPRSMPIDHYQFLAAVKKQLEGKGLSTPPGRASLPTVNPIPLGNIIHFTGGQDADRHLLLISPDPVWNPSKVNNHIIDLGLSTQYTHMVGVSAVTYHYWIVAVKGGVKADPPSGPSVGTTLAYNATTTLPTVYIPPTPDLAQSSQTGRPTILQHSGGVGSKDLSR